MGNEDWRVRGARWSKDEERRCTVRENDSSNEALKFVDDAIQRFGLVLVADSSEISLSYRLSCRLALRISSVSYADIFCVHTRPPHLPSLRPALVISLPPT